MVKKVMYSLLESLAISARNRARRRATSRANSALRILHYSEWTKLFAQAYTEEIANIQKGENYAKE